MNTIHQLNELATRDPLIKRKGNESLAKPCNW